MSPNHALAQQYLLVPACLQKFHPIPPPVPSTTSIPKQRLKAENGASETCEQMVDRQLDLDLNIKRVSKATDLGLNGDSVTFLDEEDEGGANLIVCSSGTCKFLNTRDVLAKSTKNWDDQDSNYSEEEEIEALFKLSAAKHLADSKPLKKKKVFLLNAKCTLIFVTLLFSYL